MSNLFVEQWSTLSDQDKGQIREILLSNNLIHESDQIIEGQEPMNLAFDVDDLIPDGREACRIACDVAREAVVLACEAVPTAIGRRLCQEAAHRAANLCKQRC